MFRRPESAAALCGQVLILLIPLSAIWYISASALGRVLTPLSAIAVHILRPGMVTDVESSGSKLAFVTPLGITVEGRRAVLVPEVETRKYTYGLVVFLALMMTSRSSMLRILLGAATILPFQGWGVVFDFLAQVAIRAPQEVALQTGFSQIEREFIAFAYQAGILLFPGVVPVLVWLCMNRHFVLRLVSTTELSKSARQSAAHLTAEEGSGEAV